MGRLIKLIKFQSPQEHYKADACVVWCFDDRFTGLLKELGKFFGWTNIDLIKVAGGAMGLTGRGSKGNDNAIEYIADQVEKSIKLHGAPLVILMAHKSCGAYKAIGLPMADEDENELLKEDLALAKNILSEYLSKEGYNPKIRTYLADFDGLREVI